MQNIRTTFQNVSNNTEENTVCNFAQTMHPKTVNNFHSVNANNTNILSRQFSINRNSSQRKILQESNIITENIRQPAVQLNNIQNLRNDNRQLLNNVQPRRQQSFQNITFDNPSEDSNHIQEVENTVSVEPLQEKNNAPLLRQRNDVQIEILRDIQQKIQGINRRLDSLEEKIDGNIINAMPMKPRILPFSSIDAIKRFTKEDRVHYNEVVNYFKFLNCMTLKDSVHQCVKESITMQVAAELTWWGVPDVKFPFYNTVLCQAIYQAVGSNRYYLKPTREEFQKEVVASLKVAKQRLRNARERHAGIQGRRRNLQAAADALYDENVSNHEDENISNHEDDGNQSEDNGEHITDAENENNSDEHSDEL